MCKIFHRQRICWYGALWRNLCHYRLAAEFLSEDPVQLSASAWPEHKGGILPEVAESTAESHGDPLPEFVRVRPRLFGIAYRILGSAAEAEDIVQDVWLRWQATDRSVVLDPLAFLATATTRLAINVAQSARSRRETYVGPWLSEPVDTSSDPRLGAVRGGALEFAALLLLEKLSPTERAEYVLREAFDYPYRQIAEVLQLEEANTRLGARCPYSGGVPGGEGLAR